MSLYLDVILRAVSKWWPFPFVSYLSRFQTETVERNAETTYDYVHK